MKRDRKLPVILTREQVNLLIDSMDNYKHKAITATMYSSGLRVSEVCHLRYEDIRRKQKMIHVPLSKNRQDRYTILSDRNLEILTEYWYRYNRPMGWLFPSTVRDEPLTNSTVEQFIKEHAHRLGLPEGVTPHTMRHCFACHALEDGVSHTFIQQLLGHRSPNSTDVYLQMTSKALMYTWEVHRVLSVSCIRGGLTFPTIPTFMRYQPVAGWMQSGTGIRKKMDSSCPGRRWPCFLKGNSCPV